MSNTNSIKVLGEEIRKESFPTLYLWAQRDLAGLEYSLRTMAEIDNTTLSEALVTLEQYRKKDSGFVWRVRETIPVFSSEDYDSHDDLGLSTIFYNKSDLRKKPEAYPEEMKDEDGLLELVNAGRVAVHITLGDTAVSEIQKETYRTWSEEKDLYYFPNGLLFYGVRTKSITPIFKEWPQPKKRASFWSRFLP